MLFNSIAFLVFLPIVLIGYTWLKKSRVIFILIASYFFIGWWRWEYLSIIIASTLVDFFVSKKLGEADQKPQKRKLLLGISLFLNLGLLFFFKYFNFFNGELDQIFTAAGIEYLIPYSHFLLPMGISFYTFQTLSYTIDVYNRKLSPERSLPVFALYVSFFPQLVAGPIERAGNLLGQLKSLKDIVSQNFNRGVLRILIGLFKKMVIADRLALFVDPVFDNPYDYDGSLLIIATVFFAFQIYCDFSGYSDIAIGIARLFGVKLMENFNNPYLSRNIREFWAKWHISLSTWFRDYLYIPLGGNRASSSRVMFNLLLVFVVSGLWHGANWTFIIWGALHGSLLIAGNLIGKNGIFSKIVQSRYSSILSIIATFLFVCFAWIFFRANSVGEAVYIASAIGNIEWIIVKDLFYILKSTLLDPLQFFDRLGFNYGRILFQMSKGDFLMCFALIPSLVYVEWLQYQGRLVSLRKYRFALYYILIISIFLFGIFTEKQFIYFQF